MRAAKLPDRACRGVGIIVLLLFMDFRSWSRCAIYPGARCRFALVGGYCAALSAGLQPVDRGRRRFYRTGRCRRGDRRADGGIPRPGACADATGGAGNRQPMLDVVVREGAGRRLRPILMTSIATIAGLVPIMFGAGTGSDLMQRIAAPMIGGMVSTLILTLLVLPVAWMLVQRAGGNGVDTDPEPTTPAETNGRNP
ncbi:MAG: efflux RND transporter permease subunit [Gammaproteobacteria bacterium]|nr:efflux RND transporter permease subunit [Gammaproteobacteria bacterium]